MDLIPNFVTSRRSWTYYVKKSRHSLDDTLRKGEHTMLFGKRNRNYTVPSSGGLRQRNIPDPSPQNSVTSVSGTSGSRSLRDQGLALLLRLQNIKRFLGGTIQNLTNSQGRRLSQANQETGSEDLNEENLENQQ